MHPLTFTSFLTAAILFAGPAAPAQLVAKPQLVAWSETTGPALFQGVQLQDMEANCQPARIACRSLLGNPLWYAGGTAYDLRHQSAWVSSGTAIHEIELGPCTVRCQFTAQLMNSGAVVSGLAMLDGGRRLLQLETMPGYFGLRSYDATQCPPVPLRDGCAVQLGGGAVAAGLAFDPVLDLVFVAVSTPTPIDWATDVLVARSTDKCNALCKFTLARCGPFYPRSGAVTGLGLDPCRRLLYATNGQHTQSLDLVDPLRCAVRQVGCCPTNSAWDFKGLDVVPGWSQQPVGTSCVPWQCQPCTMKATLAGGDAVLGNPDFEVRLEQAHAGGRAVLVLAGGSCGSGQTFPFLCGPLYPTLAPAPYVSGPIPVQGPSPCGASAVHPLPIPVDRSLCGLALCMQWVVACPGGVNALGLSPAVRVTLGG